MNEDTIYDGVFHDAKTYYSRVLDDLRPTDKVTPETHPINRPRHNAWMDALTAELKHAEGLTRI